MEHPGRGARLLIALLMLQGGATAARAETRVVAAGAGKGFHFQVTDDAGARQLLTVKWGTVDRCVFVLEQYEMRSALPGAQAASGDFEGILQACAGEGAKHSAGGTRVRGSLAPQSSPKKGVIHFDGAPADVKAVSLNIESLRIAE